MKSAQEKDETPIILRFLDINWMGCPKFEVDGDGKFYINGEVEVRPEVICQALSEIAMKWGEKARSSWHRSSRRHTMVYLTGPGSSSVPVANVVVGFDERT